MTVEPRSCTGTVHKAPSKEAMMVRAAETMTAGSESALVLPHVRPSRGFCAPRNSRLSAGKGFQRQVERGGLVGCVISS